jgi:hypothetical protein
MRYTAAAFALALLAGFVTSRSLALAQHAAPPIVRVAVDGSGDFATIQEALSGAPDGATIRVGKGTWNVSSNPLEIRRPVTIQGEGWSATRIVSASEGKEPPSRELLEGLARISQELDSETTAKMRQAFLKIYGGSPVVTLKGTKEVVLRSLSFQRSGPVQKGISTSDTAIDVVDSDILLDDCAILESPGTGLTARGASHVQIKNCLIANSWDKGIAVSIGETGSFEISQTEIRNNRYSGISIASSSKDIRIERCRIHGTGWHGIRYDNSSPVIERNVFHRTAVSGIYANGRTKALIRNNLFHHSGVSCWFQNTDTIESNTFIGDRNSDKKGGITQGLQVLGTSEPTIRHNLFVTCENAVFTGDIGSKSPYSKSSSEITLIENAFWNNHRNLARYDVELKENRDLPLPEGNLEQPPKFTDSQNDDFRLDEESPLVKAGIGARHFVLLESPWPVQPEEERSITSVEERLKQTAGQR